MQVHWIWLATKGCISDRIRKRIMERFSDAEEVYFASEEDYRCIEELTQDGFAALQDKSLEEAERILADCSRLGIRILTWQDAAYPNRLKNIADPPVVLYYKGMLPDFDALPLIAVVGTRKASAYGLSTAKRMGYQVAACGGLLVSGLASGIDAMAMDGALTAGATVIGVLGNGADIVYPMSNRALYAEVERRGCILTEFPPGTPPYRWNFPKRNRIMSGLGCGVLVVEAPFGSGALITANQALEQGRDVFVVPGNIDVDSCAGSNALLRDGAVAVSGGWNVMSEYEAQYPGKVIRYSGKPEQLLAEKKKPSLKVAQKPKLPKNKGLKLDFGKKKEIDNRNSPPYIDAEANYPDLTSDEEKILSVLKENVTLVDDIVAKSTLPTGVVLAALTMLEIKGVIRRKPGKRVELKL